MSRFFKTNFTLSTVAAIALVTLIIGVLVARLFVPTTTSAASGKQCHFVKLNRSMMGQSGLSVGFLFIGCNKCSGCALQAV